MSPVLSNIYLDRLDRYVETVLLPQYNTGERRKDNPEYQALALRKLRRKKAGHVAAYRELHQRMQRLPSYDPMDPDFRRLRYVRYADDFLLGFIGPKGEAQAIKAHLTTYLADVLKLALSDEKTLITHVKTERTRFLGYEISRFQPTFSPNPKRWKSVKALNSQTQAF